MCLVVYLPEGINKHNFSDLLRGLIICWLSMAKLMAEDIIRF